MTTQDPELSAALGWPGGISDPVLDRARLLQMVAALRLASQQALEALRAMNPYPASKEDQRAGALTALRAALAQEQEPEPVPHQHEWFRAGGWEPGRIRCIHCGKWGKETFDE